MSSLPPRSPANWGDEEWDLLGDLPPIGGRARAERLPALPDADAPPGGELAKWAFGSGRSPEEVIAELVADLNGPQREAVLHDGGPLVVVAGAGSGKTRVLTRRIARLVASGVAPWRILAITFTNKAADEMRRRVVELVGPDAERMWVSTFHAACVRMLRRNVERIGYRPGFSIYDDGDSRRLVEHVLDDLGIDHRRFPPRAVLGVISSAKSDLVDAGAYAARAGTIYERRIADAYAEYERRLVAANAMDFDDLLVRTERMFRENPDVLETYQERFEHVLVDEYQDTNVVQNELVIQLGRARRNVCVVGDTDQSIYRFRGAEMRNLLEFERAFPDATMIVLDQNYRSSQTILDAANAVIGNNLMRKEKRLWSGLGEGDRIRRYRAGDDRDEAWFVTTEIAALQRDEAINYSDIAVFYRTNAQSRALETALADRGIAYTVIGGTRFFDRREIRDVLAYLRAVANPGDEVSLRRIINTPRRGIGDTTVGRLIAFGADSGVGFAGSLAHAEEAGVSGKALSGVRGFLKLLEELRSRELVEGPPDKLIELILELTGYRDLLEAEIDIGGSRAIDAEGRVENLAELMNTASEHSDLESFLESTALVAATDAADDGASVSLMTLHSAKGLEFRVVFLTGMEEGLFPHSQSLSEPDELEEERRLCYVGVTRARERLYLTHSWSRLLFGSIQQSFPSRFLKEIPDELVEDVGEGIVIGAGRASASSPRWSNSTSGAGRFTPGASAGGGRAAAAAPASSGAEQLGLVPGDAVVHARFGQGVVIEVEGEGEDARATICFPKQGEKRFLLALSPLERPGPPPSEPTDQ
ncbi:MAG: UvrD-helicase domain-containing protein [Acidimicrobiales bacterium]|jgi:DNA helicase-2/ATP-dependent DNA helicase PcrA